MTAIVGQQGITLGTVRRHLQTGIDAGILKQMLPLLGGVALGTLAKNSGGGSQLGAAAKAGADPLSALSGLLGGGDDSPDVDDLLNLAKKIF